MIFSPKEAFIQELSRISRLMFAYMDLGLLQALVTICA
jgi:hypothetical protein